MDADVLKIIAAVVVLIAAIIGRKKIIEHRDSEYHRQKKKDEELSTGQRAFATLVGVLIMFFGFWVLSEARSQDDNIFSWVLIVAGLLIAAYNYFKNKYD